MSVFTVFIRIFSWPLLHFLQSASVIGCHQLENEFLHRLLKTLSPAKSLFKKSHRDADAVVSCINGTIQDWSEWWMPLHKNFVKVFVQRPNLAMLLCIYQRVIYCFVEFYLLSKSWSTLDVAENCLNAISTDCFLGRCGF